MIKTLASQIKEYKYQTILTPIFMVIEVFCEIIIPKIMGNIVDYGIGGNHGEGDMGYIIFSGVIMLEFALIALAAGLFGGIFAADASSGFAKNIRSTMYRKIQTFSFSNIDKFSTAGLVTRLTTDVTNLQNSFQMIIRMCFRAPVNLIFAMIMAYFISPRISLIYLVAVAFLAVVLAIIMKFAMKYFGEVFHKYDELNETIQENVGAIRVVKAYVREDYESKRMNKATENIYKLFVKAENMIVLNTPFMMFTAYGCMLVIAWVGAHMIVSGTLSTGDLMALFNYCGNILMSLMFLSMIFVMLTMSAVSAKRIAEVINEKPDIVNPDNPVASIADGSVAFKNVSFAYNKDASEFVLKNVNLYIKSGETIGVIGGTGSAKSSLVNLISRLYDVSEGCVEVGGVDVRQYDLDVLRNEVAVVLQNNVLFSGTILDNLRWGNKDASDEECVEACKMACADEFISAMPEGYNTHIEQGGTNVSGGQKQRLCIARALLKKPKVIIFDDSTSAVDTATDSNIRESLKKAIPGTTKFFISQRVSSVMEADRIIVMDDGVVNGFGTHEELLENNAIYKDVYESQTAGSGDFDETMGGAN